MTIFVITLILDGSAPAYEQIYTGIRKQIEDGSLPAGEKLPSKRGLAAHLRVSPITVQNAYAQLTAEGYIDSVERKGYFVKSAARPPVPAAAPSPAVLPEENTSPARRFLFDLKTNAVDTGHFPYSVWAKLMRECLQEGGASLLGGVHPQGDENLRREIAEYLREFRGMLCSPEQIVLGAGSEYLTGLITELLPDGIFAVENPGYPKTALILKSKRAPMFAVPMDAEGLRADALEKTPANIVFVTPAHHFPLGTVMSIGRRSELLRWASARAGRYLIEDDFDSEFRFALKPIPTLQSLDRAGRVIYMNTFAKTLAPSLRMGYMLLPPALLAEYRRRLMFYSCSVSEFEQRALTLFLRRGHYERHLNRMRNIYRGRRDAFLHGLRGLGERLTVRGGEAGTHLLLSVQNGMSEAELVDSAARAGVGVTPLSAYYMKGAPAGKTVVAGYASLGCDELEQAAARLAKAWG